MSRRRHPKTIRQKPIVTFPEMIEGEDYTVVVLIFLVLSVAGFAIFAPRLIAAGLSVVFFFLTVWQLYSGVALKIFSRNRKWIATYTREREPSPFYLNVGICFFVGVFTLIIAIIMFLWHP